MNHFGFKKSGFISIFIVIFTFIIPFVNPIKSQKPSFYIHKFSELENLQISYNYPDFSHPLIRVYQDSMNKVLVRQYDAHLLTQFSTLQQDTLSGENDLASIAPNNYSKKIIESLLKGDYIISLAMLFDDNSFIYGVFNNDLLLWKEFEDGFELVAIYPECIAGCLFCGAHFIDYTEDTLVIEFSGGGMGEQWGGQEVFMVEEDKIHFIKSVRYRNFTPESGKGNPIQDAQSSTIREIHYNDDGRIIKKNIFFNAWLPDHSPVILHTKCDSLDLYQVSADFPESPLFHLKKVAASNLALRVGPVHGNLIPVFWEGKWYITQRHNFNFDNHGKN